MKILPEFQRAVFEDRTEWKLEALHPLLGWSMMAILALFWLVSLKLAMTGQSQSFVGVALIPVAGWVFSRNLLFGVKISANKDGLSVSRQGLPFGKPREIPSANLVLAFPKEVGEYRGEPYFQLWVEVKGQDSQVLCANESVSYDSMCLVAKEINDFYGLKSGL